MALHCVFLTKAIQRNQGKCSSRLGTERSICFMCALILCNSASWQTDWACTSKSMLSLSPWIKKLKTMLSTYPVQYQQLVVGAFEDHYLTNLTCKRYQESHGDSRRCQLISFTCGCGNCKISHCRRQYRFSQRSHGDKVKRAQGGARRFVWPNFHKSKWQGQTGSDLRSNQCSQFLSSWSWILH